MREQQIDFMNIAPYVRLIQEIDADDAYRIPSRVIYDHELIFVLEGSCEYWIEGERYMLRAGDMHYMPPHTEHYCYVPRGGRFHYYAVHFDWVYMGASFDFSSDVYTKWDYIRMDAIPVQPDLRDRPNVRLSELNIPYAVQLKDHAKYIQPFRELMDIYEHKGYGYHLGMRSCLLKIMNWLVSELASEKREFRVDASSGNHHYIAEIIHYLHLHYHENIEINDLAEIVHLSTNYLMVLFKRTTGQTILEYLKCLRMEKAKALLQERKYTVTEIGSMVGFQDIHYFSKLFKRNEGLSPKLYAHMLKTIS
ncbi:AraC family transcriptional regulator [Paenibacillus nasutitermitis]|uniref:HTH araC/xylS-type domain-containing protein n=1 Tax=Paenibacillus nasutitermitis TaxID=1652958 RepID=A0A916YQN7_9BACL|nr:AraC family transcriptional regulator [Paenibacillus nasutitermitis]GGD57207.1 hypothetical protein GCM10010911_13750 [Paenibacillus nasutitermitis]